jgi:membrane AbrB-like protein
MTAVAAAALAGLPVTMPPHLRDAAFVLLGTSMGAGVTPETVEQLRSWPLSLALLAASVTATLLGGALYLERVHGWDRATARYASVPGALSSVLALAATSAADLPRVALAQSVRLFTLVALMPALLSWWAAAATTPPVSPAAKAAAGGAVDTVVTLVAGAALAVLLARLRVPGGMLLGAMVASALLHGSGLVEGGPPVWLQATGFVATGALIGSRFRGTSLAVLRGTLPGAVGSVLLALALSAGLRRPRGRLAGPALRSPLARLRPGRGRGDGGDGAGPGPRPRLRRRPPRRPPARPEPDRPDLGPRAGRPTRADRLTRPGTVGRRPSRGGRRPCRRLSRPGAG